MTSNTAWTPQAGLAHWATHTPDKTYLTQPVNGEALDFSWREVDKLSAAIAGHLHAQGFEAGACIAVVAKNCAYSIITDLAIWRAGFVSVPIYPSLNGETVRFILEHSEAHAIFIGELDDWQEMLGGIDAALPKVLFPSFQGDAPAQAQHWDDVANAAHPAPSIDAPKPDDLARLIYTSGSTGQPKGVMISYGAMAAGSDILLNLTEVGPDERMLSYLPLAHVFEAAVIMISSLRFGFQVYFSEGLHTFPLDLKRARPTIFVSVPRLWVKFQQAVQQKLGQDTLEALLANPASTTAVKQQVLESLGLQDTRIAITGSAPLAPSVMQWYRDLGLELLEGYGMSEDFANSHCSRPGNSRIGYVGPANTGVQGRISTEGEVQIKSASRMLGYYKAADKTAESFTEDGWFKTGDLGEYDEQGRLRITGRMKELFKTSKGKYVAPAPIENKLGHPLIELVCVSGANCPQPHALIQPSEAARARMADDPETIAEAISRLIDSVNTSLDPHEQLAFGVVLREPWSVTAGLLTPTLKIKRTQIEERYADQIDAWYASGERLIWAD